MAVSALFPDLWSARVTYFTERFSAFLPNATREWEGEAVYGNTVKIPTVDRSTTIRDYSRTANLAAPEDIDVTTGDLNIDQEKYFNFMLEDLDAAQSRIPAASLIDMKSQGAAIGLSQDVDERCVNRLLAIANNAWGYRQGVPAEFDIDILANIRKRLTLNNQQLAGMVFIITPEILEVIETNIADGTYGDQVVANYFGRPASQDAVATGGSVMMLGGLSVFVSNDTQMKTKKGSNNFSATNADRGNRSTCFIYNPMDFALVMQVNKVETYRMEQRFATGVKGLMNYGTRVLNAGRMMEFIFADVTAGV